MDRTVTKMSGRKKTSAVEAAAPPVCVALRASSEHAALCLSAVLSLRAKHPSVAIDVESIGMADGQSVRYVVAVGMPAGAKWDRPSPALVQAWAAVSDLFKQLLTYSPHFDARPDESERQKAHELLSSPRLSHLAPIMKAV